MPEVERLRRIGNVDGKTKEEGIKETEKGIAAIR